MKKYKLAGAMLLFSCFLLTGCKTTASSGGTGTSDSSSGEVSESSTANTGTDSSSKGKTETKKQTKIIGTQTGKSGEYEKLLDNQTGSDITGIAIKNMSEEAFEGNLLKENNPFLKNEQGKMYFTPETDSDAGSGDGDAKVIIPGYDLSLTTKDGKEYILHGFPFDDLEEATLFIKDDVAYIEYESVTGEQVSTFETEKSMKEIESSQ
ncbi:hypothetical protein [Enterococcus sp. LJL51]|uniref:hypothetical protein n=1 Tax=Enterococcus sp. LJL51 TaxID=3416656 RepID=UPI003CF36340